MAFKDDIKALIQGEVFDDKDTLQKYANDASLFEVMPKLIVWPKDAEDIKKLVDYANQHKGENPTLSLTARAAGTDMTGGSLNESIIMDVTKHINHIKEVGVNFGVAEPGVYYRDFEKATLAKGVLMPSFPASKNLCALGGIVSNNSSGEKTLSYGSTKDYVERLKVVFSDGNEYEVGPLTKEELDAKMAQQDFEGEVYRKVWDLIRKNEDAIKKAKPNVSKNSTGYFIWDVWDGHTFDLSKLIVGSQGTLGIYTEVRFSLIKPRPHTKMLVIFLKNKHFGSLADIVQKVLAHKPESFESYDDHTFVIALKYFRDMVKAMGGRLLTLAWRFLPEFWMMLTGGVPKLVLIAEFTGESEDDVAARARKAQEDLAQYGLKTTIPSDPAKYWAVRHESFNLLRKHIKKTRTAPFIDDIVVRADQLPEFLPRLNEIMSHYKLVFTIAGHIGDGNFHIMPLMDFTKQESVDMFKELSEKVFDLVIEFGGSLSGEHNDGIVRTPWVKKRYGDEMYKIFEEIKSIFDPKHIFNPGKKVEGTWDYTLKHIDRVY